MDESDQTATFPPATSDGRGRPCPHGTTSSSEVGLRILPRSWPLSYNSDPTCFSNPRLNL